MDTLKKPVGRPPGTGWKNWCTGPNPLHHKIFVAYGYMRQTAKQRGEAWHIDWPDFLALWEPHWHLRGKAASDLCLSRMDFEDHWHLGNVELITRREFGQRVRRFYQ